MEEDQPRDQVQGMEQCGWRDGPKESAEAVRRRYLLSKVQVKYPKRCMQLKATLMDDLKRNFRRDRDKCGQKVRPGPLFGRSIAPGLLNMEAISHAKGLRGRAAHTCRRGSQDLAGRVFVL